MDRRSFISTLAGALVGTSLAEAQPTKVYRIGYLSPGAPPQADGDWFAQGLRELGYVEGRTVVIERRYAQGRLERLPEFAAELVRLPVDVIVVAGPGPLRPAIATTNDIPIVMIAASSDPVGEGLVGSLARPGGNLTGLTYAVSPERFGKQLELLKEAAPGIVRVAVWWDQDLEQFQKTWVTPLAIAANKLGLQMQSPIQVLDQQNIEGAFVTMKQQRADALFVTIGGPTFNYRARVASLALQNRLPTVAAFRQFTEVGGLFSYGPIFPDIYRRAASFVDRIFKGARAGDLPIELPTKYGLILNLKTAKALGLTIPQSLLLRADEVIQ